MKKIHLNNAGAGLMSAEVLHAVVTHLEMEASIGGYEAAEFALPFLEELRKNIATMVGMQSEDIALCDNATRAWNTIVYGLKLPPNSTIVVSRLDFGSCLASLVHRFGAMGNRIVVAPSDSLGRLDTDKLKKTLLKGVGLVAVSHAPAHVPLTNQIASIAEICESQNVPLIIDACQSLGVIQFPKIANSRFAICGTGRKWLSGPRGTGFLGVSPAWVCELEPPTIELANSDPELLTEDNMQSVIPLQNAKRFELWEKSIANFLGLNEAIRDYLANPEKRGLEILELCSILKSSISEKIEKRLVLRDVQETGIVAIQIDSDEKASLSSALKNAGLNFSINSPWDAPLDFKARGLSSTIRLSPQYNMSKDDIRIAAELLNRVFEKI